MQATNMKSVLIETQQIVNSKNEIKTKYNKELKSFYIIFIFIFIIFSFVRKNGYGPTNTVCLCVIAKNENRYIREFVEFYKGIGVDKIFVYDNNDVNGEKFEEVISDYINGGFVEIFNYRGFTTPQLRSYKECYEKYYKIYDWFIYYDADEYIYLKDFNDIKSFLGDSRFNHCQRVQLNWVMYTDNNLLFYDNRTLQERFTEKEPEARNKKTGGIQEIKSIIRGHNSLTNIHCLHKIDRKLRSCDGFGNRKKAIGITTPISDYEYYYIKHFYSKSTEEFIEKIMKTDAFYIINEKVQLNKIKKYFKYNEITEEKLDFIEQKTKLNLSEYRKKIKK